MIAFSTQIYSIIWIITSKMWGRLEIPWFGSEEVHRVLWTLSDNKQFNCRKIIYTITWNHMVIKLTVQIVEKLYNCQGLLCHVAFDCLQSNNEIAVLKNLPKHTLKETLNCFMSTFPAPPSFISFTKLIQLLLLFLAQNMEKEY